MGNHHHLHQALLAPIDPLVGSGAAAAAYASWLRYQSAEALYLINEGSPIATDFLNLPGEAGDFDGLNDYGRATLISTLSYPFSFSAWWNQDSIGGTSQAIVSFVKVTATDRYIALAANPAASMYLTRRDAGGIDNLTILPGASIVPGRWYHSTIVCPDDETVKYYHNGYLVYSSPAPETSVAIDSYDDILVALLRTVSPTWYFDGRVKDVRLYRRSLTDSEACDIYNSTKRPGQSPRSFFLPSDISGHWPMEGGYCDFDTQSAFMSHDATGQGQHMASSGTSDIYNRRASDVPSQLINELGLSPVSQTVPSAWTEETSAGMADMASSWAATGAASTALTSQTWQGRTGLYAAKFDNGAVAGYPNNRVTSEGAPNFSATAGKRYTAVFDVAFSRPLVAGEIFRIYWTGGGAGPSHYFYSQVGEWEPRDWRTVRASIEVFSFAPTQSFSIYPGADVTGGDLTIFVDNVRYYDMGEAGTEGSELDSDYPPQLLPFKSTDSSKDAQGGSLAYPGPLAKRAQLKASPCVTFDGLNDTALIEASSRYPTGGDQRTWMGRNYWDESTDVADTFFYTSTVASAGASFIFGNTVGEGFTIQFNSHRVKATWKIQQRWFHWALRVPFDSADTGDVELLINGYPVELTDASGSSVALATASGQQIGISGSTCKCRQCDVRVYDTALSDADIMSCANGEEITTKAVGSWPATEKYGEVLYDASGNGNDAYLTGGTTSEYWANTQNAFHGNIRKGLRAIKRRRTFNGTSQYLKTAGDSSQYSFTGASRFALVVWFEESNYSATRTIASKWDSGTDDREFAIQTTNAGNIEWNLSDDGINITGQRVLTAGTLNQRQFAFGYYDAISGQIGFALEDDTFSTNSVATSCFDGDAQFTIGCRLSSGSPTTYLSGNVFLVALLKPPAAVTWSDIRDAIYNGRNVLSYDDLTPSQKTDWGVAAWHDMDGGGNLEVDRHASTSLTGVNMTIDRTPQAMALETSPAKGWQSFGGVKHGYFHPHAAIMNVSSSLVVSLWLRMGPISSSRTLFGKYGASGNYSFFAWVTGTSINFRVSNTGTATADVQILRSSYEFEDSQWHHFYMVWNPNQTSDELHMSVDGRSFEANADQSGSSVIHNSTAPLHIGTNYDGTGVFLKGALSRLVLCEPDLSTYTENEIEDILYASGDRTLLYEDFAASDIAKLGFSGPICWYDMEDQGTGVLLDKGDFGLHAHGRSIPTATTHAAGNHHNQAATSIDFTHGIAAPWTDKWKYPGYVACDGTQAGYSVLAALSGQTGNAMSVYAKVRNVTASLNKNWFGIDNGAGTNRALFGVCSHDDVYLWTDKEYEFGGASSYAAYRDGDWHDILLVIEGSAARAYVDGTQLGIDAVLTQQIDWSTFSRAYILSHSDGVANPFNGDIARIVVYPVAIMPTQVESVANLLDIRFRYNKYEDEQCRIPTLVYPSGVTAGTVTIPTAYKFGDALPSVMSHETVDGGLFLKDFRITDTDT